MKPLGISILLCCSLLSCRDREALSPKPHVVSERHTLSEDSLDVVFSDRPGVLKCGIQRLWSDDGKDLNEFRVVSSCWWLSDQFIP